MTKKSKLFKRAPLRRANGKVLSSRKRKSAPGLAKPRVPARTRDQRPAAKTAGPAGKTSAATGRFPIVGIGASAGGLEAITELLKHLPPDTGMAFVLIQHLDPTHASALVPLLSHVTTMPVTEARNDLRLEPDHVYIIPPNRSMEVSKKHLKVFSRRNGGRERLSVDLFLKSLAREAGGNAVGIILSGNGADGTQGLAAIKAAGGFTFAQSQNTARFTGMPASAIEAGHVDFVLPPERIAQELQDLVGHRPDPSRMPARPEPDRSGPSHGEPAFDEILFLLRRRLGVDFTHYKSATLRRRFLRRLSLHKLRSLKEYAAFLRKHDAETKALFNEILIHVTGFFRDAAVFEALKMKLLPGLLRTKSPHDAVRIWIPGCSSGEEVYSIAMILVELMTELKMRNPVQIFGTDVHDLALDQARAGFYPAAIKSEVSATRLARFFSESEGGYRINQTIRELCIFARQNLVCDPPFSNLDLVSCRNVLIYFGSTLQRKVMPIFHYSLRPQGLLILGASESIGVFADLFSLVDKHAKAYVKKAGQSRPVVSFGRQLRFPSADVSTAMPPPTPHTPSLAEVQRQADRIVLNRCGWPGVVINRDLEVLQFRGRTAPYLEHGQGHASLNLLKLAHDGLMLDLRSVVTKAIKHAVRTRQEGVSFRHNGQTLKCAIEVIPFNNPPTTEAFYLVHFEPAAEPAPPTGTGRPARKKTERRPGSDESAELVRARNELAASRESLQTIIQEQEHTNEELRSANEEILSSNEELQSTNEELETAKEEMQSTNEELSTLNDELENRNGDLEQVNNDLQNLLVSVNLPVLILDLDLKIRRFTATAGKMFQLIPADIGRPITQINLPLEIPALGQLVLEVFNSLTARDLDLQDKHDQWWSVRIRPYKTTDLKITGAVITFVDVDALKRSLELQERARRLAEGIVNTVREPLVVLDENLKVTTANRAFFTRFKVSAEETLGRQIYQLGNGQWNIPKLRTLLEEILPRNNSFDDFAVEHEFPGLGRRRMLLNARRMKLEAADGALILLAIEPEDPGA